jgi:large subunit ribosomal protein L15
MSILSNLKPPAGARRKKKRIGRGPGSGNGKTAGKGMNGQNARSGSGGRLYFEGGQMPLQRRVPKRGFFNVHAAKVVNVNVGALDALESGTEVDVDLLRSLRIVKGRFDRLKILGNGDLSKKLTVTAHSFSAGAKAKIEKAGGKAVEIPRLVRSTDAKAKG